MKIKRYSYVVNRRRLRRHRDETTGGGVISGTLALTGKLSGDEYN